MEITCNALTPGAAGTTILKIKMLKIKVLPQDCFNWPIGLFVLLMSNTGFEPLKSLDFFNNFKSDYTFGHFDQSLPVAWLKYWYVCFTVKIIVCKIWCSFYVYFLIQGRTRSVDHREISSEGVCATYIFSVASRRPTGRLDSKW